LAFAEPLLLAAAFLGDLVPFAPADLAADFLATFADFLAMIRSGWFALKCCDPCRGRVFLSLETGGVAALDHRLMAWNASGVRH
jgi:hypothetical protein